MATFLLWNVNRKPLGPLVDRICRDHQVDVVCLIEYLTRAGVPTGGINGYTRVASHERFGVFTRTEYRADRLVQVVVSKRVDYWRLTLPSTRVMLLALLHGPGRRNSDDTTRGIAFRRVAEQIRLYERQQGHRRTVLLGDFNANPFEPAMVSANGLHALGVLQLRGRSDRTVGGEAYDFFYNPMWRAFGYGADAGTATYHHHGYNAHEQVWHMLDQVVVRPDALAERPKHSVQILTKAGRMPLVTAGGLPDAERASDHLPVLFIWDV